MWFLRFGGGFEMGVMWSVEKSVCVRDGDGEGGGAVGNIIVVGWVVR